MTNSTDAKVEDSPLRAISATSGLLLARATSATHFGAGKSEPFVDMPVVRAVDTGLPIGPGSAVRGAFRAACLEAFGDNVKDEVWLDLFGPNYSDEADRAGIFQVDDLQLLCMPVRSAKGTLAWVTCPTMLAWFRMALLEDGLGGAVLPAAPLLTEVSGQKCWAHELLYWTTTAGEDKRNHLSIWDLDLTVSDAAFEPTRQAWAEAITSLFPFSTEAIALFEARFVVVPDECFAYLCRFATDTRPRIRRDADGTAAHQAFWYEEYVVRDALWYAPWSLQPERRALKIRDMHQVGRWLRAGALAEGSDFHGKPLPLRVQMGGKSTLHKGRFALRFL